VQGIRQDAVSRMAESDRIRAAPGRSPRSSTPGVLRAAVEEAHRHNLPVIAHAHGTSAIANALAAGVHLAAGHCGAAARHPAQLPPTARFGARLIAGTDAGLGAVKAHGVLPCALPILRQTGFGPAEALRAITSDAARACGLERRKGRIPAG
jgi:imidazolonepropionase-like amidohydrolase